MLIGSGKHAAISQKFVRRTDVVIADHLNLPGFSGLPHGRDRADRHIVVAAQQCF